MHPCEVEGHYRIKITETGLKEMQSGAVAISLKAHILEAWQDDEWADISHLENEIEGDVWIITKEGATNDSAVESLVKWAGWNGDLASVLDGSWMPLPCQTQVKREDYKGNTRFKLSFINDWNRTPRGMTNVSPEQVGALLSKYGRDLKAVADRARVNGTQSPAKAHSPMAPHRAPGDSSADMDIPF